MTNVTLGFYQENAEKYAARDEGPNPRLVDFLNRCTPEGKILEMGTGGGVDAAVIIERGFDLEATDGSPELAAIATRRLGQPVRTMLFNELDADSIYDGVYACASLTHAPRSELQGIIQKIHTSLKPEGIVWASFKSGVEEGSDALGRQYNYLSQTELISLWQAAAAWRTIEIEAWVGGAYDNNHTDWIAVTAVK